MRNHLILVGLPGSGKSTIGRLAAERWPDQIADFTDLDERIAAEAARSIPEIFARAGERGFRRLERDAMEAVLARPPHLVSAGAGWIAEPGNLDAARIHHVRIVYLRIRPEVAHQRLAGTTDRPLLSAADRLAQLSALLAVRETWYRQADAEIDGAGSPEEVVRALREVGSRWSIW
jgi:shikimate kinase